ncbi:hypothetical protein HRI_000420000 [Hibiscus trionum]|uniref:Uncharacterized protein n=1 Tax=Hibiscus trionum TaxID=183268 RepID=A0A9W7GXS8_HIBTR|nr:hypothetical protein HRI_000420000 [Hibiscus trionum]
MRSCVSRPEGKLRSSRKNSKQQQKNNYKRKKSFEKRVSNGLPDPSSDDFCSLDVSPDHNSSFSNPTFEGLFFILCLLSNLSFYVFVILFSFLFVICSWIFIFWLICLVGFGG